MNERERAEWLARTIDGILQGSRLSKRPAGLDDDDIDSLLRVAAGRLQSGEEAGQVGLQYEGLIWQRVLHRLDRRSVVRDGDPAYGTKTRLIAKESPEPPSEHDPELNALREIAEVRRKMALRLAAFSDSYKDEVWRELQSRVECDPEERRGILSFLRRRGGGDRSPVPNTVESFLDGLEVQEEPIGAHVDNLVSTAYRRRQISQMAASYADSRRDEIWQRISGNIERRESSEAERSRGLSFYRGWAFAAAAAALVVAALGPIPATGLAHHPAVDAVRFAGSHLGFTETDSAPPVATDGDTVSAMEVTAAEAGDLLGLPVVAPVSPAGFTLTSSQFFTEPVTANIGGTFVVTYSGPGESTFAVYQETAAGDDFAGPAGSARDVVLADGTPATYVTGSWVPGSASTIYWHAEGAQTLIFERNGLRTTVRYTGPEMPIGTLIAYAESLA